MVPRAAYIHVPFCAHRCGYCNFALVANRQDLIPAYLRAIEREMSLQFAEPSEVDTLYFGGGTPTQLSVEQFLRLAEIVTRRHPLADAYEWTVEANPADLTQEMAEALAHVGVNRMSLGAQSFRTGKLDVLERDHRAGDIHRSVELAARYGMAVSIDLIFAAPGETLDELREDLRCTIDLATQHVSVYGLTYEKGTTYWSRRHRGDLVEADDELQRRMYLEAIELLTDAQFEHYEVSNFARTGHRSRHNEAYWRGDEYFAAGPGAARYVRGVRETNHRSTTTYIQRVLADESPVADREQLDPEAKARERLIFALRRLEGVDRAEFQEATGFAIDALAGEPIKCFTAAKLLIDDGKCVRLSREGLLVSDALWPELL